MQVRILPGSPNLPINTGHCALFAYPLSKIMQDFAASVREHVKNTGTKPVQSVPTTRKFYRCHEKKNPGSAATEARINSKTKASSFTKEIIQNYAEKSSDNQHGKLLSGGTA
ncbi:hypothetical protein MWU61_07845 [Loktanella sp. F6476L]|uniref:hypothetical protein n=1 Tax=Loktanella sp. F6476L TaxID=2926405 RepID=UPI001FF65190|nr:hypothetical protein [Loktanella sp. F6476L]MCK0120449.1 hypothetical protein [Loktanella sp. F6476L]